MMGIILVGIILNIIAIFIGIKIVMRNVEAQKLKKERKQHVDALNEEADNEASKKI